MKPFKLVVAAASTLMLAGLAAGAELAPWLVSGKTLSWTEFRATLAGDRTASIGKLAAPVSPKSDVAVVELPLDLTTLAGSVEILGDAIDVVRSKVLDDPRLHSALIADGYQVDDVVAVGHVPDGPWLVFVAEADGR